MRPNPVAASLNCTHKPLTSTFSGTTKYTDPSGLEPWLLPWDRDASWDPRNTFRLWIGNTPSEHYRGLWTTDTATPDSEYEDIVNESGIIRNAAFLNDSCAGGGATNRTYDSNSPEVRDMRTSPGVNALRRRFYSGGRRNITNGSFSTWDAGTQCGPLNSEYWGTTEFQVGGFGGAQVINNGDGTVTFIIPNDAGASSFFYNFVHNRKSPSGPFRTIRQRFEWIEQLQ